MITTTYGYKKPETNDKGPVVFPAMEFNIDRIDGHSHNGVDSEPLTALAIVGVAQNILSAAWVATSGGEYRQLVTVPAGFNFDLVSISFRLASGHYVTPTVEKVSATQYYVHTNDNSLSYVAVYGG